MIIDDASCLDEDFHLRLPDLAVLRQRSDALGLTGLPYRVYLLAIWSGDDSRYSEPTCSPTFSD